MSIAFEGVSSQTAPVNIIWNGTTYFSGEPAGFYNYKLSNGYQFQTLCVDLSQFTTNTNQFATYTATRTLTDAPNDAGGSTTGVPIHLPMSPTAATTIEDLFGKYYAQVKSSGNGVEAAALQLAVWSAEYGPLLTFTPANGATVTLNGTTYNAVTLAQYWLANPGNTPGDVILFYSSTQQDQIAEGDPTLDKLLPGPSGLLLGALAGVGLLGFLRYRREPELCNA
ncbi:hypothetical protein AYO40_03740 [Planctomycetaceae bacterium SCGC AG-212-D15]|nr:hypothetical protein AYO40_03740 [Planctomycetaceae bacterium SCGC AG-212-D15]